MAWEDGKYSKRLSHLLMKIMKKAARGECISVYTLIKQIHTLSCSSEICLVRQLPSLRRQWWASAKGVLEHDGEEGANPWPRKVWTVAEPECKQS